MKKLLYISFVLNLGLASCLFYLLTNRQQFKNKPAVVLKGSITAPVIAVSTPPSAAVQQPEPEPFRWRQLESATDYRVYIKNLRRIGCPEQTLRDIVTGNVDRAFTVERNQLGLNGSESSPWSERMETRFINDLLGEARDSTPGMMAQGQNNDQDPVTYPLVLQKVNLAALGLNDEQKQVIGQIRQQFIDAVGGPYQDPGDPAYLARWEKALPESDDMLKSMLGTMLYENYQLAAANPESKN